MTSAFFTQASMPPDQLFGSDNPFVQEHQVVVAVVVVVVVVLVLVLVVVVVVSCTGAHALTTHARTFYFA